VVWRDDSTALVLRHRDRPAPDFAPLVAHGYLAMAESPNPMHRLWSERRWLKLALAHGCYWHRCTFCDTCLDTIGRFDPADAKTVVDWMESAMAQTGQRSFHFVDEAAPPPLLAAVARRILDRGLEVEWWTNIRFERHFTPALADLLARSGCLAVTGGLECATDRLLALLRKGFDLTQATRVMAAFARAGVLVHAYLMYGYPTQTAQETVDALELVRQLFAAGFLDSAYWHRFALTVHSPAFRAADQLGIRILKTPPTALLAMKFRLASRAARTPRPLRLACAARSTTSCTAKVCAQTCAAGLSFVCPAQSWRAASCARPQITSATTFCGYRGTRSQAPRIRCRVSMLVWNGSSFNTTP